MTQNLPKNLDFLKVYNELGKVKKFLRRSILTILPMGIDSEQNCAAKAKQNEKWNSCKNYAHKKRIELKCRKFSFGIKTLFLYPTIKRVNIVL